MHRHRTTATGCIVLLFLLTACAPGAAGIESTRSQTAQPQTPRAGGTASAGTALPASKTPESSPAATALPATGLPGVEQPGSGLPEAVEAAIDQLSQMNGTPGEEIEVVSYEPVQWPDSCLGLAEPQEMCLQVITPGYKIIVNAGGQEIELHTDRAGERVRIKPSAGL